MPNPRRSPYPRPNGLTRDRIVNAAIELLDAHGESGLTFRALALKLETGHGAIQWHVTNKNELLTTATATVLARALASSARGTPPGDAIRAVALDVFDATDAHPWLGPQLFAIPWQPAMVGLWEQIGRSVEELGVPGDALFTAVSALLSYIIGVGSQNATNTHVVAAHEDRDGFLGAVADRWEGLDPGEHPLIGRLAAQLRVHDDREEFLAGIDIILAGLTANR